VRELLGVGGGGVKVIGGRGGKDKREGRTGGGDGEGECREG